MSLGFKLTVGRLSVVSMAWDRVSVSVKKGYLFQRLMDTNFTQVYFATKCDSKIQNKDST